MNANRLRLWAAALREPHRTQCCGMLADGKGGQCCLDIAIDVYNANITDSERYPESRVGRDEVMPDDIANWYGICTDPIFTPANGWIQTASWFNDSGGYTFEQIADLIDVLADDGGGE